MMNNIEIKNYQEEFLDQQIELIHETTTNWNNFNYPNKEQLKQTYGNDNFTPHTRYYAFDGDRLVGFLSSAFGNEEGTGNLQFPFVRPGYEKVAEILMDKAYKTFQEANVSEVTCNLQSIWEEPRDVITKFGFEKKQIVNTQLFAETKDFDFSNDSITTNFVEVDPVADKEGLIKVFQTEMTQTSEQIGTIIDGWVESENIIMNVISKEDGEIITHSMVVKNNNDDTLAQMTHISIYDKSYSERRDEQLRFMFQKLKEKGYKTIQLFGIPFEELKTYNTRNFSVRKTVQYKKELTPLQTA